MPDSANQTDDSIEESISRRQWMKMTAGTGMTLGLAGCQGDGESGQTEGSGDTDTTSSGDSNGRIDRTLLNEGSDASPSQAHFNSYNPNNYVSLHSQMLFDPLGTYLPKTGEFEGILAEDWTLDRDNQTFTITIREQTWDNGDDVTAEDVKTKLELERHFDNPVWELLESVEAEDDRTVVLNLSGTVNREFLMFQLFSFQFLIDTPRSVYGEYLTALEDASGDDELQQAQEDLVQFQWEEPVATGPFSFSQTTANRMEFSTRESGHPIGEQLNFTGYSYENMEPNRRIPALNNHEFDASNLNMTEEKVGRLEDHVEHFEFPMILGVDLAFNYNRDVFGHLAFRKALALLLNRQLAVRNIAPMVNAAPEKLTGIGGIPAGNPQQYLGDTWDGFAEYGYDSSKTEEAAQVLRDGGFTKQNGTWHKPNGDPIQELKLVGPASWSWIRMTETASSIYNDFGIPVNHVGEDPNVMSSQTYSEGNFDMVTGQWGGRSPYPVRSFQLLFANVLRLPGKNAPQGNMPAEWDVPMPVGDPDGEIQTLNIRDEMGKMSTATDEEATEIIRRMAWIVNQAVPVMPVYEKIGYRGWDGSEWDFPEPDHKYTQVSYPYYAYLNFGEIQATE